MTYYAYKTYKDKFQNKSSDINSSNDSLIAYLMNHPKSVSLSYKCDYIPSLIIPASFLDKVLICGKRGMYCFDWNFISPRVGKSGSHGSCHNKSIRLEVKVKY